MVEQAEMALQGSSLPLLPYICGLPYLIWNLAYNGKQPGDPLKGVEIMVDVVRGEGVAVGKSFPASLALGSDCYNVVKASAEGTLTRLDEWKEITKSTDFTEWLDKKVCLNTFQRISCSKLS